MICPPTHTSCTGPSSIDIQRLAHTDLQDLDAFARQFEQLQRHWNETTASSVALSPTSARLFEQSRLSAANQQAATTRVFDSGPGSSGYGSVSAHGNRSALSSNHTAYESSDPYARPASLSPSASSVYSEPVIAPPPRRGSPAPYGAALPRDQPSPVVQRHSRAFVLTRLLLKVQNREHQHWSRCRGNHQLATQPWPNHQFVTPKQYKTNSDLIMSVLFETYVFRNILIMFRVIFFLL